MSESILRADGMFRWYVPGTVGDDNKLVAGTLEIAANGISTLSLVGLLPDDTPAGMIFGLEPVNTKRSILGILKDCRYVFLRQIGSGGTTFSKLSHQSYQAREAVVFDYLNEIPDLNAVTKLLIGLNSLEDWASEPAVKVRKTQHGATARASKPKTQTFKLP